MSIPDDKLLNYNKKGLIPGPNEDFASYIKRVEYAKNWLETASIPFTKEMIGDSAITKEASNEIATFYDIAPTWVSLFFSNYQLMPWHGGCAWIFQVTKDDPTGAFFQLRTNFRNSSTYLFIYSRKELMVHELAHVGRMMFDEPKYEELIAYRTSKSRFRSYFGPLVQSSTESAWFVFLLFPIIFFDLYLLLNPDENLFWHAMWLKLAPLGLILMAVLRLVKKQRIFKKSLKKLTSLYGEKTGNAVIYRLTDKEIDTFAKMDPDSILDYIAQENSLRWHATKLLINTNSTSKPPKPRISTQRHKENKEDLRL